MSCSKKKKKKGGLKEENLQDHITLKQWFSLSWSFGVAVTKYNRPAGL